MSGPSKYLLVSLPTSISPSNDKEEALTALRSTISNDNGAVLPFKIPEFKIGTLDALVQQADDLAKLENACEGVVAKVGDSLRSLLEGDEAKIAQQKTVNDKPVDQYLRSFNWNKVKYRADKPLAELIDSLQKELASIDNDVKAKFTQYNQVKTNLIALQRRQTSYETISPMVVPRSSVEVAHDEEFTLFAVTTFKKYGAEFQHKCREMKWTPRDYKYVAGGKEEERKEVERTVLRYGLPLDFVCGLVKTNAKLAKKAKANLDSAYSYLGGNAFGRDNKGRVTKDDSALSSEMAAAGVGAHGGEGSEYTAYVYYEFEII
ncbi:hypothetical protein G7Y89_g8040 [Cudoniella acicularis]|uniref:V-type proton ATPase subunit C n=1 Tax=Cudoniella acicularis TaxID=354080 RepID=A0A8H4RHB3_9HELO|nr:hypothetical protein G7Y89_g8040 [Cudoniella acicularis]